MQRIILILLSALVALGLSARYSIHSFTEGVKVEVGGKSVAPTKGMAVKAADYLVIPQGGKVEIYNDVDKRVYTSIKSGKISVTRLMIDARGAASDNNATVISKLQFGKKGGGEAKNVYVEKGMVRRSLAVYDPEADNVEMDGNTLGRYMAAAILSGKKDTGDSPVSVTSDHLAEGGMKFRVENTLEYPVYFNVIKISYTQGSPVEISLLGQPAGSYVVLPGQSLAREHFPKMNPGERHILVMTRCQYDIDEVIERINESLSVPETAMSESDLPVYFKEL